MTILDIEHFKTDAGRDPFQKWYNALDNTVRSMVDAALTKMAQTDYSNDANLPNPITHLRHETQTKRFQNVELYEMHVDKYRIYFGVIENKIVIFHACEKNRKPAQSQDIVTASERYLEYHAGVVAAIPVPTR